MARRRPTAVPAAAAQPPGAGARSDRTASRALAVAVFAVAFGTNVPTALLLRYRELLDLTPTAVTVAFAVYAAGLVPALLLAGPASDRKGRRPAVLPFVVISGVASVILLLWATSSLAALLTGRFLQGVVSGVTFSVGSAWLAELDPDPAAAARRASIAMSVGFALGPLTSGILGQFGPWPDVLSYVLHLATVVVALALALRVPETVAASGGRGRLLNLGVPAGAARAFVGFVLPTALLVFTFPSIAATVLPLGLQAALPGLELVATGLLAGGTLAVGVLVQPLARRVGPRLAAPVAAASGAGGLLVGAWSMSAAMPWLLAPCGVLLGAAYGLALPAGLTVTQQLADPAHRGALVSTFLALTYLGFGAPVVLSSLSADVAFVPAALGFAVVAGGVALWLAAPAAHRWVEQRRAAVAALTPR